MITEMPKPESGPEAIKRRAQLVLAACERYSKGGNSDQDIWFFRGMAVQELDDAVRTGRFLGQSEEFSERFFGETGDIWAAPVETRIKSPFVARYPGSNNSRAKWDSLKDAQEYAKRYAKARARIATMLETVGVKVRDDGMYHLMIELEWADGLDGIPIEKEIDRLLENNLYVQELEILIQRLGSKTALVTALEKALASEPRGVVLGIHKDVLDSATSLGTEDEGVRIGVGERGLRFEDVSTIQVLGDDARQYVGKLKNVPS